MTEPWKDRIRNPAAKLTADDARTIRERHAAGEQQSRLAREFGVTRQQVHHVVHGVCWASAGGPIASRYTEGGATCARCGAPFVRAAPGLQRYCSAQCRRRAHEERHGRVCSICGEPNPTGGKSHRACRTAATRDRYLNALRDFINEHGRAPTAAELGMGSSAAGQVKGLPSGGSLHRHFGSVREALIAAGVEPRAPGHRLGSRS